MQRATAATKKGAERTDCHPIGNAAHCGSQSAQRKDQTLGCHGYVTGLQPSDDFENQLFPTDTS